MNYNTVRKACRNANRSKIDGASNATMSPWHRTLIQPGHQTATGAAFCLGWLATSTVWEGWRRWFNPGTNSYLERKKRTNLCWSTTGTKFAKHHLLWKGREKLLLFQVCCFFLGCQLRSKPAITIKCCCYQKKYVAFGTYFPSYLLALKLNYGTQSEQVVMNYRSLKLTPSIRS